MHFRKTHYRPSPHQPIVFITLASRVPLFIVQVLEMWAGGEAHEFRACVPRVWAREGAAAAAAGSVVTPMPGRVIKARSSCNTAAQASRHAACLHVARST